VKVTAAVAAEAQTAGREKQQIARVGEAHQLVDMGAKRAGDAHDHIGVTAIGELHTCDRPAGVKGIHAVKQIGACGRAAAHRTGSSAAAAPRHAIDHRAEAHGTRCR